MENMNLGDASDAVSSMEALRNALTTELDDIEAQIHVLRQSNSARSSEVMNDLHVLQIARSALHSGLASINEVLGWVRLMAAKDSDGNMADVVKSLPSVPAFSVH